MGALIVGTDQYGVHVLECILTHEKSDRVIGFAQWNLEPAEYSFCGKPIFSAEEIKNLYSKKIDIIYIAIPLNKQLSISFQKLHEIGIKEALLVPLYVLEKRINIFDNNLNETEKIQHVNLTKPNLAHLETHVVDNCNINCMACNNFSPLFCKDEVDEESFYRDLAKLSGLFDKICRVYLLGGEPLLNPQRLTNFIRYTREKCKTAEIRVLTNGILILKTNEEVFDIIKKYDAIIQISLYAPTEERISEICGFLKRKCVKFIITAKIDNFVKRLQSDPISNPKLSEEICGSAGCTFFRNGELSKCPDSILVRQLDKQFSLSLAPGSVVKIDEIEDGFRVLNYLNKPIEMCRYCAESINTIEWGPISNSTIDDWLITKSAETRYQDMTRRAILEHETIKKVEAERLSIEYFYKNSVERCTSLEKRNIEVEKRNILVEQRVKDVENRNKSVEERMAAVENRNSKLATRNNELESRNHRVEQRVVEVENRNVAVEERNAELESRNNKVEERLKAVEERNNELEARNLELEARNKLVEQRLSAVESRNTILENRVKEVEDRNKEIENRNKVVESRNKEIENRNREVESRNKEIENRNKEVESRNRLVEDRNRLLEERVKEVEDRNIILELRNAELDSAPKEI